MAKGTVNKAIIIGRLGADPDFRITPGDQRVANFNVATNRVWKDKEGNFQEETEWHRIVVWNRLADRAKEYIKKGHRVYVEGRIVTRSWQDQNGQTKYTTEIVANDLQMLEPIGSRESTEQGGEIEPPVGDIEPEADENVPF